MSEENFTFTSGDGILAKTAYYKYRKALENIRDNAEKAMKMLRDIKTHAYVDQANTDLDDYGHVINDVGATFNETVAWTFALRMSCLCDDIEQLCGNYGVKLERIEE